MSGRAEEEEENVQIFVDLFDFDERRWHPRTRRMAADTADGFLSRCPSKTAFSLGTVRFERIV